jgi:AraC family transcriptional regulator of arabinose operon
MSKPKLNPFSIDVGAIGYQIEHGPEFVIDRPQGSGDCVFLQFLTEIFVEDSQGRHEAPAGSCLFYTPPHPQWYCAPRQGFNHHWFHFGANPGVALLESLRLPQNRIFGLRHDAFVAPAVQALRLEFLRQDTHWQSAADALLRHFLVTMSRALGENQADAPSPLLRRRTERLKELRVRVHDELEFPWTVEEMAAWVRLSPSRLSVLYRQTFGLPPMEDLIRARLERARQLLTNTTLSVAEVARSCGFASQHYFSRLFHQRIGCVPRDYYKTRVGGGELNIVVHFGC